jgi:peptide/nickel transport system substrate-binding protein
MVRNLLVGRLGVWLSLCVLLTGCPSAPPPANPPAAVPTDGEAKPEGGSGTTTATADTKPAATPAAEPATVLLEPYTPPSLEELNAQTKWIDRPVENGLELLRKYQAEHPAQTTAEQALALENKTPEDNRRILEGLGKLPASDAEVDWDATFNQHSTMNINAMNGLLASSIADSDLMGYTGIALTTFDWTMRTYADSSIIQSWQSSEDRTIDKMVLRNDLTWTDGKPVTAHDIVFSFQQIMNPKILVPAVRSGPDQLKWIHAYDDYTLVIFHKESLATNEQNLNFPIIPKHYFETTIPNDPTLTDSKPHVAFEQNPVTCGPYRVAKYERDKEIVFERRPEWYEKDGKAIRDKPYFKTIRMKIISDDNTALLALKKGDIDALELRPEPWMTQTTDAEFYKSNTKSYGTEWSHSYIGWNIQRPWFRDVKVRQAMSYAINHKEMLENICYSLYEPGQGIFHPSAWMAPKNMPPAYTQDLDKAEDLLEQAGWIDSDDDGILDKEIDGKKVKFEFALQFGSGSKVAERICGMVSENLKQIGIACNVKPTEFTVLQADAKKHNFDAMCAGWGSGADPDTSENLWTTKALQTDGRNYVGYSNPEVDKLFEDGKREFDREKRADIYRKIALILWEDQPYTWLYFRSAMYAYNKSLRGYMYSPRGPFHYSPGIMSIWKAK